MKAIILVGGQGARLLPITSKTPKAMVPILNRPFLEYLILYLKKHGISEIILALGHLPGPIQQKLGDGSRLGVHLIYSIEPSAMGTAGAIKYAEKYLDQEPFFVLNGDTITCIDLDSMLGQHYKIRPRVTIALTPVDDPSEYGVVELDDRSMVQHFIEKPARETVTTNMINAGIYIVEPEVLNYVPASTFCMIEKYVFPKLLHDGKPMLGYPSAAYWIDIGTPKKYLQAQYDLLSISKEKIIIEGKNRVDIQVKQGSLLVGNGCVIAKNTEIVGPSVLGDGCRIDRSVRIDKAILWSNNSVGENTCIKASVIASNCMIGKNCYIGEGTIIGENVRMGSGCETTPGTRIWPDLTFQSGEILTGKVTRSK